MECESVIMMHGDRRLGVERRSYAYSGYYPERRSEKDRRCGVDRRRGSDNGKEHGLNRRCSDKNTVK